MSSFKLGIVILILSDQRLKLLLVLNWMIGVNNPKRQAENYKPLIMNTKYFI
jgi:hypothetical protein